jgi:hypothetical protein
MKANFKIHKGELSFTDNSIEINDKNSRRTKILTIFNSVCVVFYGIVIIIKYFKTNDPFDLWPGLIIVTLGIPGIIFQTRISFVNKIRYNEIETVIIKYTISNFFVADFMLSNGKKRRVVLDFADIARFGKFSLEDLTKTLNENSIKTEIK